MKIPKASPVGKTYTQMNDNLINDKHDGHNRLQQLCYEDRYLPIQSAVTATS
jgi:hypothetical protein